ncbi:MAG: cellulose binding domain-containing protein [Spirochaetales bacterium]|nr:cellulose binding domain-containing protein [Spirochaetales bacterium]
MDTGKAGSSNSCFIENNSSNDIDGWKIEFDANLDIYDYWCFTMKRTNRHYEFTNLSWNSLIKAGTSIEVGFNANNDVTIKSITNVKINGTAINFVLDVPGPVISINADDDIIISGDSTLLSWNYSFINSYSINNGIGTVYDCCTTISPSTTTTYTITGIGPGGTVTDSVTVIVRPGVTVGITADSTEIIDGESTVLRWETQNANNVTLYNEAGAITTTGNSLPISPGETTTYTIIAEGEWTSVTDSVTVTVRPAVIVNITADSTVIASGDSTILRWETQNANNVTLYNETGPIITTGNSLPISPGETTTYTIYAEGEWAVAFNSITIIVEEVNLTDYLAYWPLEEVDTGILQDISGNGFDGLYVVYPEWIEGTISDYALNFNSDNGYIIIENDSSFDTDIFTVSAWLTLNDLSPCDDIMAAYFRHVNKWHLKTSYNTLQFGYKDESGNEKTVNSGYMFSDAGWHLCVIVVNNTEKTVSFYVDGDKVAGPLAYDGFKADYEFPWNLLIGQYDNEHQWDGAIDDVRFYPRALNDPEIKALIQ